MKKFSLKLLHIPKAINNQQHLGTRGYMLRYSEPDAGYSLVEMLAVVIMLGILAAIMGPSWFAFMNRQQLNQANDAVVTSIQETQRQAQKNKTSYSVSFRKNGTNQPVEVAIYPTLKSDGSTRTVAEINTWQNLGGDAGINSRQLLLGANLKDEENAENTINNASNSSISFSLTNPPKITFDYMGTLPKADFGIIQTGETEPPGLRIVLAMPTGNNSTSPSGVKRCVIIKTLLGSVQTAQNDKCS